MTTPIGGAWPLCGREADVELIASWHRDPAVGGVVVSGDAGVGKSSLAAEVATRLAVPMLRIAGNPALATVPFGALAHELSAHDLGDEVLDDRARVVRTLTSGTRRTVVLVDDPTDLDEGTLGVIAQIVSGGHGFMIATTRTGAPLPAALVALERTCGVRRVTIEPLDAKTVAAVLAIALSGQVTDATANAFADASAGNPLYLREIVDEALGRGALVRDSSATWRLDGDIGSGRRLTDVIADRIGRLPDDVHELAKMLALAGSLRWSTLERAGRGDATLNLESADVVVVDDGTDPTVELAHPLHNEVLRSELGVLERRRLLGQLIEWFDGGDVTPDERLRIVDWELTLGRQPDLDTLQHAAQLAFTARDRQSAERYASAAIEQRPSLAMAAVVTDALMHSGRADEADSVAERYLALDDGSAPRDRSRLVGLRVFNDLWFRERPDEAAAVVEAERRTALDPIADDELTIQAAYVALARTDAASVLELLEGRSWSTDVAPQGLLLTGQVLADCGRAAEGVAAIEAAALAAQVGTAMAVSTPSSIDAARVRLAILVGDLDRAEALIAELSQRTDYRSDTFLQGYLMLSAGRIALVRGRPVTARRCFTDGRAIGEQHANRVALMGCTAGLAIAAAWLRDGEECRRWYDDLVGFDMARVVRPSIASGMAWALATTGRPVEARELLIAEAHHSLGRAERVDAAMLACDLSRLGGAAEARPIVELVAPHVDGLARLWCEVALALGGSANDSDDVEHRAVEMGATLLAAEIATANARQLRRRGDGRAANAAVARVGAHLATCEGASPPGAQVEGSVSPLSSREREIASLAADGLSNQAIAERLFVSARTVGNHLQNAYTKLGVTSRAELGDALGR